MLRLSQIKLPIAYTEKMLKEKAAAALGIPADQIAGASLIRRSLDARKKPALFYVVSADIKLTSAAAEKKLLRRFQKRTDIGPSPAAYRFAYEDRWDKNTVPDQSRPVIAGFGPAGMVCGYYLALAGLRPLILERGRKAEERSTDVERFWEEGVLRPDSNVQFGEGGAGLFSDGKLNTLVKDKEGRCREVLSLFVSMGAPEDILYDAKPHVGTDRLQQLVRSIRSRIEELGGTIEFETALTGLETEEIPEGNPEKRKVLTGVWVQSTNAEDEGPADRRLVKTDQLILATGHSARDTYRMLKESGIAMQPKAFAAGFRVIHPQKMIDEDRYGMQPEEIYEKLGAAPYKLTAKTDSGRGVYSFCMCPGGYVINASSEKEALAVNGMSYRGRDSAFANAAVIVTVTPEDFEDPKDPLSGIAFQRQLERKAFLLAEGNIPVQLFGDFKRKVQGLPMRRDIMPLENLPCKGGYRAADLTGLFSGQINGAFVEGMQQFGRIIPGFDADDVPLCGVESRTSSPVRILRDEQGLSSVSGIYPVGEGAGYAGGITSAAMDGLLAAERVCKARLAVNDHSG